MSTVIDRINERKKNNVVLIFFSFLFFIYGPISIYLTNINDMWFGVKNILWPSVIICIVVSLGMIIVSTIVAQRICDIYIHFVFGLDLAIFIQGSFMGANYGVLDGNEIDWSQYTAYGLINTAVWLICIAGCVCAGKIFKEKFSNVCRVASLFLLLVQMLTLIILDMIMPHGSSSSQAYMSNTGVNDVGDENIVVFVLDNYDDSTFKEILDKDPEFLSDLDGFTYFNNNTGKYTSTKGGLPYLLTGVEYFNEKPYTDYISDSWNQISHYRNLYEDGWDIGIYTDAQFVGVNTARKFVINVDNSEIKVSSTCGLMKTMYKCTAFKFFPHILKKYVWMYTDELDKWRVSTDGAPIFNDSNQDYLEHLNLNNTGGKKFRFIHLWGAHAPFNLDENVKIVEDGSANYYTTAKGALNIVYSYIEQLKRTGNYDNTTIAIVADHGYTFLGRPTNPIFLFKQRGTRGALKISNAPVSQDDLWPTIMKDVGLNGNNDSAFDYFEGDKRERTVHFYSWGSKDGVNNCLPKLIDYSVDSHNNNFASFHLIVKEQDFEEYKLGTVISFSENGNARKYYYNGFSGPSGDTTWAMGGEEVATMGFKLNRIPEKDVNVVMNLAAIFNGKQKVTVVANDNIVFDDTLENAGEYSFVIKKEMFLDEYLKLEIQLPDANSPYEVMGADDNRILSIEFVDMKLKQVD